LVYTLWSSNAPATLEDARTIHNAHPAIVEELAELLDLLEERAEHLTVPLARISSGRRRSLAGSTTP